jgi:hypothetical protein
MNMRMEMATIVRMMALIGLGALAIMVLGSAAATITGDAPPASGDWVVNSDTTVTDETVYVDGNMTVNGNMVIRGSTIVMNVSTPLQYIVEVTSSGHVTATDATFASNHSDAGYGFRVTGRVDLLGCHITGTEDGLRILTDGAQTIASTTIDDFHLCGLYLEGADGTQVTDLVIRSDRYEALIDYTATIKVTGKREHFLVPTTGPLHIDGGAPSIDGLMVSVNGTTHVTGTFHFYAIKTSQNLIRQFGSVMLVETEEPLNLANVQVIDCAMDFVSEYTVYEHVLLPTGKHTLNNQYYIAPVLLHGSTGVSLDTVRVEDVRIGYTSMQATYDGNGLNTNEVNQGSWGIMLLTTDLIDDTVERSISLRVVDSVFMRIGAVNLYMNSIGLDDNLTRIAVDMVLDNLRIEECPSAGAITVDNSVAYKKDLQARFEISITNSTFKSNAGSIIGLTLSNNPALFRGEVPTTPSTAWAWIYDNITIRDNVISENFAAGISIGSGGSGRTADAQLKDEKGVKINAHVFEYIYIEDNLFEKHNAASGPVQVNGQNYPHKGLERVFIRGNTFRDSITTTGNSVLVQLTGKEFVRFQDNTFTGNSKSCALRVGSNGGDADTPEPVDVVVSDNTFVGNRFWHNNEANMGMMILATAGDVTVTRNTVTADESRAFVNILESPRYAGYANFNIVDNQITASPDMTGIVYLKNFDVYHSLMTVTVDQNLVRDCGVAPLLDYYDFGPDLDAFDYDATIVVTDNTLVNATEEVIRAHGDIEIINNTFTNCRGYIMNLQYLNEHIPVISDNVFDDCDNLIYLGAKVKCLGGLAVTMEDMDLDCTGNALRFSNMQVVLNNCLVSGNADPAIIAENSVVSIVGGDVKVGSGRIIGTGHITRFHVLEAYITWTNATMVDSGKPAVDVPVMLLDAAGGLVFTRETDDEGSLGSVLVPAWTIRSMFIIVHTPHTLLVGTSGIASSIDMTFDHDYVGVDALELSLLDDRVPVIGITTPVPGQQFRSGTVRMTGFVLEIGSGLEAVRLSVDDGPPVDVTVDRSGTFEHTLTGLAEGTVKLTLEALDVAGNVRSREMQVVIDMTPPEITVLQPAPGLETSRATVELQVQVDVDTSVYVNGRPFEQSSGTLVVDWPLTEGENIILVKAVDVAGNSATEAITVTRDSVPPILLLLHPQDGLLTKDGTVQVSGETEPGLEAWITVMDGTQEMDNVSVVVASDGSFSTTVDLDEGTFDLRLTCRDGAGNTMSSTVTVTVDTSPPAVAITSPADGTVSRGGQVHVVATTDAGATVTVNGMPVANDGGVDHLLYLGEGESVVRVTAVDAAGNAATDSVTVTVDSVAPTVTITSPQGSEVTIASRDLQVTGLVTGDVRTLTVMGEEVTVTDGSFSTVVTMSEEGVTLVTVTASDEAGNTDQVVLRVDAGWTPPTLDVDLDREREAGKAVMTCTVTGDCVGLMVVHTSGSGETTRTVPVEADGTYTLASDLERGDNTIVVRALDGHGGFTESEPMSVTYRPSGEEEEEAGWGAYEAGVIIMALGLAIVVTALLVGMYRGGRKA